MQKKHPDLTHQELADTQGLSRSTVTKVLLRYGIEKEKLDGLDDRTLHAAGRTGALRPYHTSW